MTDRQSANEYFRSILLTVMGQPFDAAGYILEEQPVQWAGGMFRFVKPLDDDLYGFIEFQHLAYSDSEWASGMPSRFRVSVIRSDNVNASLVSTHPRYTRRTLSALVVEDFGVAILPSSDHWWTFKSTEELGNALAEAAHLLIGYAMPWLAGDLKPGEHRAD
ncbi:MAG: hypothetical protein D6737_16245 [Chloroflexi bacterium]|nr:MAG: hypothetical protein D6737_16245 [Chloroflexota bacterium]